MQHEQSRACARSSGAAVGAEALTRFGLVSALGDIVFVLTL